jgi:hypothetical protein
MFVVNIYMYSHDNVTHKVNTDVLAAVKAPYFITNVTVSSRISNVRRTS